MARQATEAENSSQPEEEPALSNEVQPTTTTVSTKPPDQQTSESKSPAIDELNFDSSEEPIDEEDRNKRLKYLTAFVNAK